MFDELEKSRSHILVDQMAKYFKETSTGRFRASRVIPEPFFVHSELTSLVQVADLVAYVIAWGLRYDKKRLTRPARPELDRLARRIYDLRYIAAEREGHRTSSLAIIPDLRPLEEKELDGSAG